MARAGFQVCKFTSAQLAANYGSKLTESLLASPPRDCMYMHHSCSLTLPRVKELLLAGQLTLEL